MANVSIDIMARGNKGNISLATFYSHVDFHLNVAAGKKYFHCRSHTTFLRQFHLCTLGVSELINKDNVLVMVHVLSILVGVGYICV